MVPELENTIVGRNEELSILSNCLDESMSGHGQIVMISGVSGIGKTRLADEVSIMMSDLDGTVLRGSCYGQSGAPPYWPWMEATREATRKVDTEVLAEAIRVSGDDLFRAFPNLQPDSDLVNGYSSADPSTARFRSLDAAASLFKTLASTDLVVVILEDLHWADAATLQLLSFMANRVRDEHLFVIGTYRDSEVGVNHPLQEALVDLRKLSNFTQMPIGPLQTSDAQTLASMVAKSELSPSLLEAIQAQTGGNPFFIVEISRGIRSSGNAEQQIQALPRTLRAAVVGRLRNLDENTLKLLTAAALLDRSFTRSVIVALEPSLTESEVHDSIESALAAAIITEYRDIDVRYRFAHGLIPQTLLQNMDAATRATNHVQFAGKLEQYYNYPEDAHVAEVAQHLVAAGSLADRAKTAHYSYSAGTQALRGRAYVSAAKWFGEVLDSSNIRHASKEVIASAHHGLGIALATLASGGRKQPAWDHLQSGFELYLELGQIQNALNVVSSPIAFGRLEGTTDTLRRAVQLAGSEHPQSSRLLINYANAVNVEEHDSQQALELLANARKLMSSDSDAELDAVVALAESAIAYYEAGVDQALERGHKAESLALGSGSASTASRLTFFLGNSLLAKGRPLEAMDVARRGVKLATDLGTEHDLMHALRLQAQIAFSIGEFQLSLDSMAELHDRIPSAERTEYDWLKSTFEYENDLSMIRESLDLLSPHNLAIRALERIKDQNTRAEAMWTLSSWKPRWEEAPFTPSWSTRRESVLALVSGAPEAVDNAYRKLSGTQVRFDYCFGSTDRILGRLALKSGRADAALIHFKEAVEFCHRSSLKPELVLACVDLKQLVNERDDQALSADLTSIISKSTQMARDIGMNSAAEILAELQTGEKITVHADHSPDGLTKRQQEVLQLVAAGLSNQEIGERLFISHHAVATHIANIRTVVNAPNRVALAAYANRVGLGTNLE